MADGKQSQPKTAKSKDTISDKAHQKTEEEKDKAFVEITRLTRMLIDKIEKQETTSEQKRGFFHRNTSAIQAISAATSVLVTIALAYFAYTSWKEVKSQRELSFKQFVIANLPSISIYADSTPSVTDDKYLCIWKVHNQGGPVKNVLMHAMLIGVHIDRQFNILQFDSDLIIRNTKLPSVGKEDQLIRLSTKSKASIALINTCLQSDNKGLLLAIRISYEIPEELSLKGEPNTGSQETVFLWEKEGNRFESIKATSHEIILDHIRQEKLWDLEDRG